MRTSGLVTNVLPNICDWFTRSHPFKGENRTRNRSKVGKRALRLSLPLLVLGGLVTIEFSLSREFCKNNFLDRLDLNLMCVRVKDSGRSGKDTGYWVGHFQISEELRMKEEARKNLEGTDENASRQDDRARNVGRKANKKKNNEYRPLLARLIHSSAAVPEPLITQGVCHVTAELILLSIPNRLVYTKQEQIAGMFFQQFRK